MQRRAITVQGLVQGVGFRPFVYELASRFQLAGTVRNDGGSVFIDVEGDAAKLEQFLLDLKRRPPPLARIDHIDWRAEAPRGRDRFEIEASQSTSIDTLSVCPDIATCSDCLRELFDPRDRRYRYPFINCTNCGPRLTIILGAPYDRQRTTMALFPMCDACRREYENPADRRFHAEPIACAVCGPRLRLLDAEGKPVGCDDPLHSVCASLREGKIVAIKGLGGFHLACDATSESAVRELRRRKRRDEKPFAVMVQRSSASQLLCEISADERAVLESNARPIVLLRKREAIAVVDGVAPGNLQLGIMLPYTPLHHLLMHELDGLPLVMTSGNQSDEPIAYRNDDAIRRLAGIADLFLVHNREIHVRCDDSVTKVHDGRVSPIRLSRGYAPQSVKLPMECPEPLLAVGGQLKSTFAIGRGTQPILSHHLGDLDHFRAFQAFERDIELYKNVFAINPRIIVHDLHPDYASTQYARRQAEHDGGRLIATQHHHAHIASCMAEHGLDGTVIGVSFDGTGFGTDGTIWGGEFFVCDYLRFERVAHLRDVPMPGGERAIHEPWRMALAHLMDAGVECDSLRSRIDARQWRACERMIERRFNTPMTSSVGRLFDAVASIAGVQDVVSFEAQAAMKLEWLARQETSSDAYPFALDHSGAATIVDTRPLIRAIAQDVARGVDARRVSRRFHSTITNIVQAICREVRQKTNFERTVLSGGAFMNGILAIDTEKQLGAHGFRVYRHQVVPANDGGLSLGQLAIAAAQLRGSAET